MRFLQTVLVICICILSTACIPQGQTTTLDSSVPCDGIIHPALLSIPFEVLAQGREQAETWILTEFPTATVEFQSTEGTSVGERGWFSWSAYQKHFMLSNISDDLWASQISEQYPTLGHILHCYGSPRYFTLEWNVPVSVEAVGGRLELWYPERGLHFWATTLGSAHPDRFDSTSAINGEIEVRPKGTVEEMIRDRIRVEENVQARLALLQEWPKNFTEFVSEK